MAITSRQLAELAGVSRGTVDRVLYHRGGVSPEVQERIEQLAKQYGYVPNRAGKALVMREPLSIGVLMNSLDNPFFDDVRVGLQAACDDYSDFPVVMHLKEAKGFEADEQLRHIEEMVSSGKPLGGLIITPINHPDVAARLNQLVDDGCPVIALNSDIDNCRRMAYVGCDYVRSGQTAAQMLGLITQGHARILVVTGSLKMMGHQQRVSGFAEVIRTEYPQADIVDVLENNDDDILSAKQVTMAMRIDPSINALYFSAGGLVGGVGAACALASRPLSIVACDLTRETRRLLADNTVQATIGQQPYRQGYQAMKLMLDTLLFHKCPEQEIVYTDNEILTKYNS